MPRSHAPVPEAHLSWPQVAAWRLRRQSLDRRAPRRDMLAVVSALCGLQAQLMSSAEVALWARVADLERDAVSRALWEDRSLVKTWGMRRTLHLFASTEYGLWQPALPSLQFFRPAWFRYFGVTAEQMDTVQRLVAQALYGRILTREQLSGEIGRATGSDVLPERVLQGWLATDIPAFYERLGGSRGSGHWVPKKMA
jgi:Winged helix DNA-binding domain